ncbi:MAG: hypothetical protein F6K28_47420 [Microcoleus sp. SIO2G3]|nr:hypothetical protein [Microcoleus sp. SIO2G3]
MAEILVLDTFLGCATQAQNQVLDSNTAEVRIQESGQTSTNDNFPDRGG